MRSFDLYHDREIYEIFGGKRIEGGENKGRLITEFSWCGEAVRLGNLASATTRNLLPTTSSRLSHFFLSSFLLLLLFLSLTLPQTHTHILNHFPLTTISSNSRKPKQYYSLAPTLAHSGPPRNNHGQKEVRCTAATRRPLLPYRHPLSRPTRLSPAHDARDPQSRRIRPRLRSHLILLVARNRRHHPRYMGLRGEV